MKRVLPPDRYLRVKGVLWRHVRPFMVDYCPVTLPWFPGARGSSSAARLHRLAVSFHWRRPWSPVTALGVAAAAARWPIVFAVDSLKAFRVYSKGVQQRYGTSRWSQCKDLLRYGLRHNIPPLYYYRFRLFDRDNGNRAPLYIHADEIDILYPMLTNTPGADQALAAKDQFFRNAREHGLPVADAVATFDAGGVVEWFGEPPGHLPASDLVLKPVDLACGRGFERWHHDDVESGTWRRGDRRLTGPEFLDHCGRSAAEHRHILQVRLRNHSGLKALAGDGLSTVRAVTYRRPTGESGFLFACLRMPTGTLQVDNFEAGGIAARIDLDTGVLGAAVAKDPRRGTFARHPDSGAPIEGAVVPFFRDAKALVLEAHRRFPWMPFVGWDIVITDSGPLILEANTDWCVELTQIVMNRPLGDTAYPEIFLQHVAALNRAESNTQTPAAQLGTPLMPTGQP